MPPDSGVHSAATPQLVAPTDNLALSADSIAAVHATTTAAMSPQLAVLSASSLSSSLVEAPVVQGQITLNNCNNVRIGHEYRNSGDVVINQKISVVGGEESVDNLSDYCKQIVVRDVADSNYHTPSDDVRDWLCHNKWSSTMVVILILLFIAAIILFLIIKYKGSDSSDLGHFEGASIHSAELEREYPQRLKFVLRDAWGAAQPTDSGDNNSLPVERVIMCHTASRGTCNKFSACRQMVLSFQEQHMGEHKYSDIGYNFVIGGDGYIYMARGWDKVGAHSKGFNYNSLGVAFVGDFRVDELNDNMKKAAETLMEFGVQIGKISKDYQVYGHCQVLKGLPVSPGKNVMKFLRTWSHWNNTNLSQCKG